MSSLDYLQQRNRDWPDRIDVDAIEHLPALYAGALARITDNLREGCR